MRSFSPAAADASGASVHAPGSPKARHPRQKTPRDQSECSHQASSAPDQAVPDYKPVSPNSRAAAGLRSPAQNPVSSQSAELLPEAARHHLPTPAAVVSYMSPPRITARILHLTVGDTSPSVPGLCPCFLLETPPGRLTSVCFSNKLSKPNRATRNPNIHGECRANSRQNPANYRTD